MRLAAPLTALLLNLGGGGAAWAHGAGEADLGKAAQLDAGVRTVLLAPAVEMVSLPARVLADPRRELRVAASQDGMIEPEGKQLPVAGQTVRAGQVLAWLRPMLAQPDRRDVGVDLAAAERDKKLVRLQIDRYGIDQNQPLEVKLPTPAIEILTSYRSAEARSSELQDTLDRPLPLVAPRSGTILRSPAVAGRVVAGGQTLFDISAPGAAAVEAEFPDDDLDAAAVREARTLDGRAVPLLFLGATRDAGLRSHRALYSVATEDAAVTVNQPLLLEMPRRHDPAIHVVPAEAVFSHDGHTWVWVHTAPQHFVARHVEVASIDSATVSINAGLHDGERVVAQGATALIDAAHWSEE